MRRGLLAVVLISALVIHSPTRGDTLSNVGKFLNPIGSARAKIDEAHTLLMTQHPLDATRFVTLLMDAHKLAPVLDRENAAEWRGWAIRSIGYEGSDHVLACVDRAATLNPRLAFDDTVTRICS